MDLSPHKIKFILPVLPTPTHLVQPSMPKATTGKTLDIFSTVIISLSLCFSRSLRIYMKCVSKYTFPLVVTDFEAESQSLCTPERMQPT